MDRIAGEVLDDNFKTTLSGSSKDFVESSSSLMFAFVLALIFIYLVLSAQFESFRDPLIIMFTVPLALIGAMVSLWYFDQTMNIFSQIGIIMLIGLVSKNGILIVEFANQRKATGEPMLEAVKNDGCGSFPPYLNDQSFYGFGNIADGYCDGCRSRKPCCYGYCCCRRDGLRHFFVVVCDSCYLFLSFF